MKRQRNTLHHRGDQADIVNTFARVFEGSGHDLIHKSTLSMSPCHQLGYQLQPYGALLPSQSALNKRDDKNTDEE